MKRPFTREAYYGLNFLWFGVDTHSHVAEFCSGFAPIPAGVFSEEAMYNNLLDYFETLPITGAAVLSSPSKRARRKHRSDYSLALAQSRKGLYVFADDFDDTKESSYLLSSKPEVPLSAADIPQTFRDQLISLPVSFPNSERVEMSRPA